MPSTSSATLSAARSEKYLRDTLNKHRKITPGSAKALDAVATDERHPRFKSKMDEHRHRRLLCGLTVQFTCRGGQMNELSRFALCRRGQLLPWLGVIVMRLQENNLRNVRPFPLAACAIRQRIVRRV